MKKIPLWKVIVLSIVTLGFYQFYWLAVQKKYLEKATKSKLVPTGWLISVVAVLVASYACVVTLYLVPETATAAILALVGAIMITSFYVGIIMLWWTIVFLLAADKVLQPRVSIVWLLVHCLTLGTHIYIAQYYANKKPDRKQKAPSKRFVSLSLTFIIGFYFLVFAAATAGVIYASYYSFESQNRVNTDEELSRLGKLSDLLWKKHDGCLEKLDTNYPTVTDENEDAYLADYDLCEDIRLKQNEAAEAYNKREQKLLNESW